MWVETAHITGPEKANRSHMDRWITRRTGQGRGQGGGRRFFGFVPVKPRLYRPLTAKSRYRIDQACFQPPRPAAAVENKLGQCDSGFWRLMAGKGAVLRGQTQKSAGRRPGLDLAPSAALSSDPCGFYWLFPVR